MTAKAVLVPSFLAFSLSISSHRFISNLSYLERSELADYLSSSSDDIFFIHSLTLSQLEATNTSISNSMSSNNEGKQEAASGDGANRSSPPPPPSSSPPPSANAEKPAEPVNQDAGAAAAVKPAASPKDRLIALRRTQKWINNRMVNEFEQYRDSLQEYLNEVNDSLAECHRLKDLDENGNQAVNLGFAYTLRAQQTSLTKLRKLMVQLGELFDNAQDFRDLNNHQILPQMCQLLKIKAFDVPQ